jgi:hypothetical protein
MDLSKFSRDDGIVAGLAFLLAIDVLFLPWFDYLSNPHAPPLLQGPVTLTGVDAPDGWLGVLGLLAALAVIADLALDRLGTTELPSIGGSRAGTRLALSAVAALFLALKFILHAHFSLFGFGFWAAFVLTIALLAMGFRALEEEAAPVGRPPGS